ncbi:MAG: acetylglutamate kinase [Cyanobacteria bacterium P01_G01_bin.49]
MNTPPLIRQMVEKALYLRQLTPEIETTINGELTRLGYISDVDYEALELLMSEMDEGRIQLAMSHD